MLLRLSRKLALALTPPLFCGCLLFSGFLRAVCGDAIVDVGAEECDDGEENSDTTPNACRTSCLLPRCGDGVIDGEEECDDQNTTPGDGCNSLCQQEPAVCGDLIIEPPEQCDDGNTTPGDGCDAVCQSETVCGDAIVDGLEQCDDGNNNPGDGCSNICLLEGADDCGDGQIVDPEECDDGNTNSGDGCDQACIREECGNAITQSPSGEECDDGNNLDNDGCDNDCKQSGASSLDVGDVHTCVILRSGDIRCFGEGSLGRLGYGNTNDIGDNELPSSVAPLPFPERAVQLALGGTHTCALFENGIVRCWGEGGKGRLGYHNTTNLGDNETLGTLGGVLVLSPDSVAIQIAAGGEHTCALLSDQTVRCWGNGSNGRLGYGNNQDFGDDLDPQTPFAPAVDVGGPVIQIALGESHSCALLSTGNVRCWGNGADGRLGYGSNQNIGDDPTRPIQADINLGGSATQITAGSTHTCALLTSGNIRCWGKNGAGQLGQGNTASIGDNQNETPANFPEVGLGAEVLQVSAGGGYTCARLANTVQCWGKADQGRLGYANGNAAIGDDPNELPPGDVNVGAPIALIVTGGPALLNGADVGAHTCALLATREVRCWGFADRGQLGYGNPIEIGDNEPPASAGDVPIF